MAYARTALLILLAPLLAACAATTLRSSWIDGTDRAGPPRKLAVFVAVDDEGVRRMAENRVVQTLPPAVGAAPAHRLAIAPGDDEADLRRKLAPEAFDAALVARLVSVDTSETYVPPQTHFMPDPLFVGLRPYHRSFYAFYPVAYAYTTPGYTATSKRIVIETVLYRLPEGRPVWSAVTETVDPDSSAQIVDELIAMLGKELLSHGLLPAEAR